LISKSTFAINLRVGDSLSIDSGRVIAELVHKSGQQVRMQFTADKDAKVDVVSPRPANQAKRGVIAAV